MVKAANKRSSTGSSSAPVVQLKKADPGLQSLIDYGDNLEEFLAICAHLPNELKDDLKKVAALNESTHTLTAELSRDQAEILELAKAKYRQMTRPEQFDDLLDEDALQRSRDKRRKVDAAVSEKVSITKRMYEALDTCIKSIDEEISTLENDVKESYGVMPDFVSLAPEIAAEAKRNALAAAAAAGGATGEAQAGVGAAEQAAMLTVGLGGASGGLGALGMGPDGLARRDDSVSANEPVYCVCRQIGWGDMIGCDNEDCEHGEWFHYHCVGLEIVDQKQLSYWLCPGCSADVRDKERREKVEKVKSPTASQAGAQSSAVKVSDKGERSGEGATEAAASAGVPPAAAGISAEGRAANLKLTNDANVPDERASTPAGKETKEQSGGSHAPVDAARSDKAQNYTSPQKDEDSQAPSSVWQGLGGMGGNALPEGTGLDRSGAEIVPGEKRGDTEGSDRRGNGTVAVTGGTSTSSEAASALAVAAGTLAVTSDGPTPEDNAETRTHLVVAAQGKGE